MSPQKRAEKQPGMAGPHLPVNGELLFTPFIPLLASKQAVVDKQECDLINPPISFFCKLEKETDV